MANFLEHLGSLLPGRTALRQRRPRELKAAMAGPIFAIDGLARPAWSGRNYAAFAREGMMRNAVAYRCIRMIAEAASAVKLTACRGLEPVTEHGLLELLRRPAPGMSGADLFERWYGTMLVSGNVYVKAVASHGQVQELHLLRPDRVSVRPGPDGWPAGFEYTIDGRRSVFGGEVIEAVDEILHVKMFHPVDDHYGLSPVEAAASAIDIHNTATLWNKALLDNAARPSGALVYTAGGHLSGEQFDRLKEELEQSFQGARNAGRPMLLEGGLDWKAMSLSPRDMDFIEAKNAAAREIALALGVPPMLLGIPGDNTYANYQEANRSFWRQTVLPLVDRSTRALSTWLGPAWDEPVELKPDIDAIEALQPEREALWRRLENASFLTEAEKRAAVGYGERSADEPA
ncbi:MAG: phage portal protein [Alphaproteobacteria bacterium]|nr:phage portal protein [Alphaproteobacteria bacterium]